MFTLKLIKKCLGHVDMSHEPNLINKQFKYRTLGEMVALSRATNTPLLPTRNGVYTGEVVIPRENLDKVNLRNQIMDSFEVAEQNLKDANEKLALDKKEKELSDMKAKIISDYEKTKSPKPLD